MLDLENSANWELRLTQFFATVPGIPLSEYTPIFDFTSNIIAILVSNAEARDTWNLAGWLEQRINLPFEPSSATSVIAYRKLWLRQKQLLIFSTIVPSYKIAVRFPKWFTQASVTIWEYHEPQGDTTENQLNQIESKLDTLLQQHPP